MLSNAAERAQQHADNCCHWCPRPWTVAVDTTDGRQWKACWNHTELLPPWEDV